MIQQPLSSGRRSLDRAEDVLASQLLIISETGAEATGLKTKPLIIFIEIILAWWIPLSWCLALAVIFPVRVEDQTQFMSPDAPSGLGESSLPP